MEDLEKHIFDPKNPKGCKVYNLLLKIVKDQNNAVFLDPYFFLHIFDKEIFDTDLINSLWDKPANFQSLSTSEKVIVYEQNFSIKEFISLLKNKNEQNAFDSKPTKFLFTKYLIPKIDNKRQYFSFEAHDNIYFSQLDEYYLKGTDISKVVPLERRGFNKNQILFSGKDWYNLINGLLIEYSSVLITTLEDYRPNPVEKKNIKPLLLLDINHISLLIEILSRDLMQEKAKENTQADDIHYLNHFRAKNFFSIQDLKLQDLAHKKEIYFVGENGDGKTALLQAITLALKGDEQQGLIVDFIRQNSSQELILKSADNAKHNYSFTEIENNHSYKNLFAYGAHRHRNDSDKAEETGYLTLFNDEQYLNNPVKWLQHLDYKQAKGEETSISLEKAKELLKSILDNNVEIEVSPDEVAFIERGTKLKFEQLSEGYKSVIIWVSDLIKRLSDNQPYIASTEDFRGIVLVDEIELHLHPKWKYRIVKDLRTWFPKIQFIFTTHSPTVVLGASPDAVFYKVYKEEGVTKISSPIKDISHLTANSLLTSPLFELESMTPRSTNLAEIKNISSDDYIYQKIHQAVAEKINNTPNLVDEDVMRMVEEELKKLESEK